jgi:hypothetical protein
VQAEVSAAEREFLDCWETLASLQQGRVRDDQVAPTLIGFQPKLAKAQYKLTKFYNAVCEEERRLHERRPKLNRAWAKRRLQTLRSFKGLVWSAVDIGKVIGDGFAWLFYQREKELLRKHYAESAVPFVPTGVGGKGEITFVEKSPKFGSYLVLLHSITSFLRLGDISLIDLQRHRVAGIGELKSHSTDNTEISIRVMLMGSQLDLEQLPKASGKIPQTKDLPQVVLSTSAEARMQRQLKRIRTSLAPEKTPQLKPGAEVRTSFDYSAITEMFNRRRKLKWNGGKISNGLGAIGVPVRGASLFSRLSGKSVSNHPSKMNGVLEVAKQVVDKSLPDNSIHIDSVLLSAHRPYELLLGMRPLFWWPLPLDVREAIAFRRWHVMTVFNAAFLIAELRKAGLSVTGGRPIAKIEKVFEDGRRVTFVGVSNCLQMIRQHLVPEETIAQFIIRSIEAASVVKNGTVHINFDFNFY